MSKTLKIGLSLIAVGGMIVGISAAFAKAPFSPDELQKIEQAKCPNGGCVKAPATDGANKVQANAETDTKVTQTNPAVDNEAKFTGKDKRCTTALARKAKNRPNLLNAREKRLVQDCQFDAAPTVDQKTVATESTEKAEGDCEKAGLSGGHRGRAGKLDKKCPPTQPKPRLCTDELKKKAWEHGETLTAQEEKNAISCKFEIRKPLEQKAESCEVPRLGKHKVGLTRIKGRIVKGRCVADDSATNPTDHGTTPVDNGTNPTDHGTNPTDGTNTMPVDKNKACTEQLKQKALSQSSELTPAEEALARECKFDIRGKYCYLFRGPGEISGGSTACLPSLAQCEQTRSQHAARTDSQGRRPIISVSCAKKGDPAIETVVNLNCTDDLKKRAKESGSSMSASEVQTALQCKFEVSNGSSCLAYYQKKEVRCFPTLNACQSAKNNYNDGMLARGDCMDEASAKQDLASAGPDAKACLLFDEGQDRVSVNCFSNERNCSKVRDSQPLVKVKECLSQTQAEKKRDEINKLAEEKAKAKAESDSPQITVESKVVKFKSHADPFKCGSHAEGGGFMQNATIVPEYIYADCPASPTVDVNDNGCNLGAKQPRADSQNHWGLPYKRGGDWYVGMRAKRCKP